MELAIIFFIIFVILIICISLHKFQRLEARPKLRRALLITCYIMALIHFPAIIMAISNAADEQVVETRHYKDIHEALNDGSVYIGMTCEEIEAICGPADSKSRSNGVVEYAYYGFVQLCFNDYGEFYKWND